MLLFVHLEYLFAIEHLPIMKQVIPAKGDIVSSLLFKSFGSRKSNEKKIIVQEGQANAEIKYKDRVFQDGWYTIRD